MRVLGLPLLSDNYAWLLVDDQRRECAVVDPSEAEPVLARVRAGGWTLRWVLATHHHWDHTGGIAEIAAALPVEVYGSHYDRSEGRIPAQTHAVGEGDRIEIAGAGATCYAVPGHTLGAVAFHFEAEGALFTGDTLFTAGCGRLFEGDPEMMWTSLQRLRGLGDETQVYCGHEYTQKNLRFARSLLPGDAAIGERLREVDAARARGEPTVPASLAVERRTNPFLRADDPLVAAALGEAAGVATFAATRRRRDSF